MMDGETLVNGVTKLGMNHNKFLKKKKIAHLIYKNPI